jgi:membrane protein DedA with SNARE-associated domain
MPDLSALVQHWGYVAIFVVVVLGNVGLPVPEETVLALAGYLVYDGVLRLPLTLAVGVLSAAAGDNVGYWIGRRLGRPTIERYGARVGITRKRLETIERFVIRYGALGVVAARFIPGVRVLGGPLAGAGGLAALPFVIANLLGALVYVPYAVGIGYALAWGLGPWLRRIEHVAGKVEHVALLAIAVGVIVALVRRRAQTIRRRRSAG